MLLVGGPRDGWCYYTEDIEEQETATERMGKKLDYERSDDFLVHPVNGVSCRVWRWLPPQRFT